MADAMQFPESWKQFLHDYEFRDSSMEYTNGSMLIPSFRVEQMIEHYFRDAEPVVRCGECIHWDPENYGGPTCDSVDGLQYPGCDDFCSNGERRGQSADVRKKDGGAPNEP